MTGLNKRSLGFKVVEWMEDNPCSKSGISFNKLVLSKGYGFILDTLSSLSDPGLLLKGEDLVLFLEKYYPPCRWDLQREMVDKLLRMIQDCTGHLFICNAIAPYYSEGDILDLVWDMSEFAKVRTFSNFSRFSYGIAFSYVRESMLTRFAEYNRCKQEHLERYRDFLCEK